MKTKYSPDRDTDIRMINHDAKDSTSRDKFCEIRDSMARITDRIIIQYKNYEITFNNWSAVNLFFGSLVRHFDRKSANVCDLENINKRWLSVIECSNIFPDVATCHALRTCENFYFSTRLGKVLECNLLSDFVSPLSVSRARERGCVHLHAKLKSGH